MLFKSVILLVFVTIFVEDVISLKIWGKLTNYSEILERILSIGDKKLENPDPDLTKGRKAFGDSIILVVKKAGKNNSARIKDQFKDDTSESKGYVSLRKFMDLKKNRAEKAKADLVKSQHDRKVNEITEFINEHYMTTNYLYNEIQRIKKQKKVKDDLRRMIEYLEQPEKVKMKAEVLQCYYDKRKTEVLTVADIYHHEPNNLVINIVKDPYNDAFIN